MSCTLNFLGIRRVLEGGEPSEPEDFRPILSVHLPFSRNFVEMLPTSSCDCGNVCILSKLHHMLWPLRSGRLRISFVTGKSSEFRRRLSTSTEKQYDPLNILFCGADEFSIYSLRALHELRAARPDRVARIDVLCRPDKRVGRGLKQIQEGKTSAR